MDATDVVVVGMVLAVEDVLVLLGGGGGADEGAVTGGAGGADEGGTKGVVPPPVPPPSFLKNISRLLCNCRKKEKNIIIFIIQIILQTKIIIKTLKYERI